MNLESFPCDDKRKNLRKNMLLWQKMDTEIIIVK